MKKFLPLALLVLLFAPFAFGAQGGLSEKVGQSGTIEIDADSMELRSAENLVLFSGAVTARRGDMVLQADKVEVSLAEGGRDVQSVRAMGNVRIRRGEMIASGGQSVYDVVEEVVTLSDGPKVWRGRDAVEGKTIRIHLADERVEVDGARAVMFPQGDKPEGKR